MVVLNLVWRDVNVHGDSQAAKRFEETSSSYPRVLPSAVSTVQPVHLSYSRNEFHHGAIIGRKGLHVMKFVDELKMF